MVTKVNSLVLGNAVVQDYHLNSSVFGPTAGHAVEGNTVLSITTSGDITGGGTLTLGSGGTLDISYNAPTNLSDFTDDLNVAKVGDGLSIFVDNVGYALQGSNISTFNNDAAYVSSGSNISLFVNDAGYLTSYTETDPTVPGHVKSITTTNISNWNTAYSWGNHATVGYLTSYTETDPTVPSHVKSITTTEKSNWNTAFSWGDHSTQGYITSYTDTNDIDYINSASFNTTTGVLTLSGVGNAGATVDLDGRYSTTDTQYAQATSTTLGLVKIGYAENGKNYPVELSNGQMFVNVPWTDTDTDTDNYVDSAAFNSTNGILTLGRTGALSDLTVDLDGRYLTSYTETDTLDSVTSRGNTTTNNITVNDMTISGNLTVNGTTTTVNATELAIQDNMIYLNDGSTVTNPDLGWVGNYNDGTYAHTGVFRDASDGRFKFFDSYTPEPGQSIDTAHATFAFAPVQASTFYGALSGNATTATKWQTARTISLGGDLSGSVSLDGSTNVTLTATVSANSVALGTDTTGNYMSNVSAGTGINVSHTAGEGSTATISHADTSTVVDLSASSRTYVTGLTFDGMGHVTGYTTGIETVVDTDTTYSAGNGIGLSGTTFSVAAGGGLTQDANGLSHSDTSTQVSVDNANGNVIQDVTLDTYGHVTALGSVNLDTRYYTESEIDTKLSDGTVTKIANAWSNTSGNMQGYVNDGGGNLGIRFNATSGGTNNLVENGQAYEIQVNNDSNQGDFLIYWGTTSSGTAGDAITWNEAFRIEGTDGKVHSAYNFVGDIEGNATTASKWATARTISLSGDVTGSVSIDGSGNVDIATTIASNSVALGTDTTGNYAAAVAVSGNGLGLTGTAGEGTTFTVTSNAVSTNTADTIVYRDSGGNFSAGVITATATQARYADLAENYTVEYDHPVGTVMKVSFSDKYETDACEFDSVPIGVISEKPAFLMNEECEGQALALKGRVPVRVVGAVKKGQPVYTHNNGCASTAFDGRMIVGVALETNESIHEKLVECVLKI
jgi:hypothetical protein